MTDFEGLKRAAVAWCEAWNRRDLDSVMGHYADAVEFSSPTVPERWGRSDGWLHGKEELRANFAIGIAKDGLHFEFVDILFGIDAACILYRRENGAVVADLVEFDNSGHAIRVVACYGRPRSAAERAVDIVGQ